MKTKGLLLVAFLLGMLFSAQAADHVKGNGQLTTKKITIGDYNAIKIDGVIDFSYEQSEAEPYLEVTVDENLHPYVNIDIKDRELTVNFKGAKVDHYTKFIVKTNSKWLKAVKAAGNANFMVNSTLTGDELKINACLNYLKHLQLVELHSLDYLATVGGSEELYCVDFNLSPEYSLLYKELQEQVDIVMYELPSRCREVFMMSRFKKMKNREIAEVLQISTTAVEKHIAKALAHFSRHFKDKYPLDVYIAVLAFLLSD